MYLTVYDAESWYQLSKHFWRQVINPHNKARLINQAPVDSTLNPTAKLPFLWVLMKAGSRLKGWPCHGWFAVGHEFEVAENEVTHWKRIRLGISHSILVSHHGNSFNLLLKCVFLKICWFISFIQKNLLCLWTVFTVKYLRPLIWLKWWYNPQRLGKLH